MRATDRFHTPARLGVVFLAGLLLSAGTARAQDTPPRFPTSTIWSKIDEIVYMGAKHLDTKELQETTGLKRGDPLIPILNQVACHRILDLYYEQGRPLATVSLVEGTKPTDSRIVFNITEGPKVKIQDIDCTGNTFVSTAVLKTHLKSSPEFFATNGCKYSPLIADSDVESLEGYYRIHGFLDVKVNREMRWVDDNHVDLVFHVNEGLRYRVGARPQVEGAGKEVPLETIEAIPHLKAGDYTNDPLVKREGATISEGHGPGRDAKVRPPVYFPDDPKDSPSWWCPMFRAKK